MKVIIDTNVLMVPHQFGVDIFEELASLGYDECLVPRVVVAELLSLADSAKGNDRIAARVGLSLAERCRVVGGVNSGGGSADDEILRLAVHEGFSVCTNDAMLRKRLSGSGVTVVYLRSRRRLSV
ncbi:DNA-binding protein [Methanosarcinales archaeon ex4572_44]|nr:MAG: DNA-binding protein [Methanosarcinales archaeon ex4572_44]RLG26875.1 MAG: DNA-binding protein [Methanosarcinales archaeon]RLG27843.1 MAG: DNA-binding protein [Methanosarcinales archaeon]HHI30624.1 DNA-binding protein [Candidatus Methanoperedenaceae archaeon]